MKREKSSGNVRIVDTELRGSVDGTDNLSYSEIQFDGIVSYSASFLPLPLCVVTDDIPAGERGLISTQHFDIFNTTCSIEYSALQHSTILHKYDSPNPVKDRKYLVPMRNTRLQSGTSRPSSSTLVLTNSLVVPSY